MALLLFALIFHGWSPEMFPQQKIKIAVIPKSNIALFWKSIHAGVNLGAVASAGVEILWRAPQRENDVQLQIAIVEQCIDEGVNGILLAPMDGEALAAPVLKATMKKIPVLIFDSGLKGKPGDDFISLVRINNREAGYRAGEKLVELLGGKGKVVIVRYVIDAANITEREAGFLEAVSKYKGIQVIEKNRYVSTTADVAMDENPKIAGRLKEADGVFCSYEQSTMGVLKVLRHLGLAGKLKFVGFDTPVAALEALKKGEISALVAQDPARMGYLSVKAIVDYLHGKKIDPVIDTGVQMVTCENLDNPEIQKLLALPVVE
jgi:ribose transport system substrate-binding protein